MSYATFVTSRLSDMLHPETMKPGDGATLMRMYAVLVFAKGENVTLEDVHDVWSLWKTGEGWTYGEVKNNAAKVTPYLVPFADITDEIAAYDQPYVDAIKQVAREYGESNFAV